MVTLRSLEPDDCDVLESWITSADAMPYTVNPIRSKYDQTIIRGKPAKWVHHDPRPCLLPPDWSGGYTSIFALQQEEAERVASAM